ncbi:MAG: hypothetical protein VKN33_10640 [Candidatus Sericytochromatia bacterium]|nr:hypothetical protein [Candidatus Sericytochromatia bacterium]
MTPTNGVQGPGGTSPLPGPHCSEAVSSLEGIELPLPEGPHRPAAEVVHDTAQVAHLQSIATPQGAAPVDIAKAATAEIQKILPGAILVGEWSVEHVALLKEALLGLPKPMRRMWHGYSFHAPTVAPKSFREKAKSRNDEEAEGLVRVQERNRAVLIQRETFALPGTIRKSVLRSELAAALGRTAAKRPRETLAGDFSRLSGWTVRREARKGAPSGVPKMYSGEWPEAISSSSERQGVTRSLSRARGTGALSVAGAGGLEPGAASFGGGGDKVPLKESAGGASGFKGTGPLRGDRGLTPYRANPIDAVKASLTEDEAGIGLLGSKVRVPDQGVYEFQHDGTGGFVGNSDGQSDPSADLGESFRIYVSQPEQLLARSPGKFLLINLEAQYYTPQEVRRLAQSVGVDLSRELAELGSSARMNAPLLEQVALYHGISVDLEALRSTEQRILMQGGTLETLVHRLSLDLATRGAGTVRDLRDAEILLDEHKRLLGEVKPVRELEKVGFPAGQQIVAWLSQKFDKIVDTAGRGPVAQLLDVQAQFHKLPLAVQLKVSPELALGSGWLRLGPTERMALRDPNSLQSLVASAAESAEEVAYLPQRLNATEKRRLAVKTMLDALLDTGPAGAMLRTRLGATGETTGRRGLVLPDPVAAFREMLAANGDPVFDLLGTPEKASLSSKQTISAIRQVFSESAMVDALQILRRGSLGAENLRAAILKFAIEQGRQTADPVKVVQGLLQVVQQERQRFEQRVAHVSLDLALSEATRHAREGDGRFVRAWLSEGEEALQESLGPWLWGALSSADRRLLLSRDYRVHVAADAQKIFTTGSSLAEEARQFHRETENLQAALELLLNPDDEFPREFTRDPVGALVRRGIFPHLPEPIQTRLLDGIQIPKVAQLVKAIEETLAPLRLRQLSQQRQRENLSAAIRTVNAANYAPILGILDMDDSDMQQHVRSSLVSAVAHGDSEIRGGMMRYL